MINRLLLYTLMFGFVGYAYGYTVTFKNPGEYKVKVSYTFGKIETLDNRVTQLFDLAPGETKSISTWTPVKMVTAMLKLSEALPSWRAPSNIQLENVGGSWTDPKSVAESGTFTINVEKVPNPPMYTSPLNVTIKYAKSEAKEEF